MKRRQHFIVKSICTLVLAMCLGTAVNAQTIDHGGADLTVVANTTLGGYHININIFTINTGVTVRIDSSLHFLSVSAANIIVNGIIEGSGKGALGGNGGTGGAAAGGSGSPGHGGLAGTGGYGSGAGLAGTNAGNGGTISQICGGLFCSGNQDGLNGGGGGAGGGSGGSYAGYGGGGGWGAYGTGFTGATGGTYGNGGLIGNIYGNITTYLVDYGSGGGGGGGGGGAWGSGLTGGIGGAGGGMVELISSGNLTIGPSGRIYCDGLTGGGGGTGSGESSDNSYDCSSDGYSSCTLCPESVYDAAGGAGGGAGGGSGGGIRIQAWGMLQLKSGAIIQAKGGDGGVKGYPNSTLGTCFDNAAQGGGGGGGRIKVISTCNPLNQYYSTITVDGGIGYGNGSAGSYNQMNIYPDAAGSVTGFNLVCQGQTSVYYSITPVTGATGYIWTVPTCATIVSGSNTNSISVDWGSAQSGNITVAATNDCGPGPSSSLAVTVNPLPDFAGNIIGSTTVCTGDNGVAYSVPAITGATGYNWTVPAGALIASGYNTSGITVNWGSAGSGTIGVNGTNACGSGTASTLFVTVNTLPTVSITGAQAAYCIYTPPITLQGNPLGGSWTGTTNGAVFTPAVAGQGNHTVTYTYTDGNNCSNTASTNIYVDLCTGINESDNAAFSIYPNPNNGTFMMTVTGSDIGELCIYNILGAMVYRSVLAGEKQCGISISGLGNGLYFLRYNTNDKTYSGKITIVK